MSNNTVSTENEAMSADSIRADGGGVDRHLESSIDHAEGTLRRYVEPSQEGMPSSFDYFDQYVTAKCKSSGYNPADDNDRELIMWKGREALAQRAHYKSDTLIGKVTLDLTGTYGNRPWESCEDVTIIFVALTSKDVTMMGLGDDPSTRTRAIAIRFDASLAEKYGKKKGYNGAITWQPSSFDDTAYTGILACFGSLHEAREAKKELQAAVATIREAKVDGAYEDDPVRHAVSDAIERGALDVL